MARCASEGVVVLRPRFGSRGYDVIGVGFDSIGAIRDANWRDNQCRLPDAHALKERPEWLIVKAKISVSYAVEDIQQAIDRSAGRAPATGAAP